MQKKFHKNDTQRILRAIEVKVATGKSFSDWHKQKKKKLFKKIIYVVITMKERFYIKKLIIDVKNV